MTVLQRCLKVDFQKYEVLETQFLHFHVLKPQCLWLKKIFCGCLASSVGEACKS